MPSIETKGQLVYTTWIVEAKARYDTVKVQIPQLTKKQGTIYLEKVDFHHAYFEYQPFMLRISKELFEIYHGRRTMKVHGLVDAVAVDVVHYQVRYALAIRFDSSSGRVVSCAYQPAEVARLE